VGNRGGRATGLPARDSLTPGRFVAGCSARAKASGLGIIEETREAKEYLARVAELNLQQHTVR